MSITDFTTRHYRHFNAATLVEASDAWIRLLAADGRMMVTLAGAMSTAELGISLAELIRRDKVHAISCTGANLEEDLFNLVAHDHYTRIPDWRNLTREEEKQLEAEGRNRVTDTCIPEEEAIRAVEEPLMELWRAAQDAGYSRFPHQYLFELLRGGTLADRYQIDPADSWLVAAAEKDLPIFVPGWEDSTLGNVFAARLLDGSLREPRLVRTGIEVMHELARWYARRTMGRELDELETVPAASSEEGVARRAVAPADAARLMGFFQIGGGIAGDFPICVVPMIHQDLLKPCPYWGYFCQISDSTTSYGSYSGAFPSEKITWGKLDVDTPAFLIESDATIVAPLVFGAVLDD
ncbi:MAG: deoxyhypusine synthase family protein [Thermoanaerobaculia bacterium]|nr:deoxyhypusine synthase family protein [Thermoanaerobaculia bacterium]